MFDRFSDNSKRLMAFARQQALELGHEYIGPEHLLLGLLQCEAANGFALLRACGADPAAVRASVLAACTQHPPTKSAQLPFTPQAKKVLEGMFECATARGDDRLGTEHCLIALATVPDTIAARALARHGLDAKSVANRLNPIADLAKNRRLLLISNSTMHGGSYLGHCAGEIRDFLGGKRHVMFVPYALHDHAGYAAKARTAFAALGHDLVSAHEVRDPRALDACDAVFVGGGNTFRLLKALYDRGWLRAIRQRVAAGMPYIGSSAGTNVATLSIRTTNDMPIVMPPSFAALDLVPFQINPHYLDPDPNSTHMGETREERLRQFHEENETPVLGLREGCMLRVEGERMELRGSTNARLFRQGQPPQEFAPPCDLSFLLAAVQ
ncbi:MAG: dipeptidase PepE [Planctomycetes bacterium]|nr:dipeptidase PepE [Planctomycetota bacterium]